MKPTSTEVESISIKVRLEGLGEVFQSFEEMNIIINNRTNLKKILWEFEIILSEQGLFENIENEIVSKIRNIYESSQIEFHEDIADHQTNETLDNEPFIADPRNLTFELKNGSCVVRNQGYKVIELSLEKSYIMIIKKRSLIQQRHDLLFPLSPPITETSPIKYNIYLEHEINGQTVFQSSFNWSLSAHVPQLNEQQKLEALIEEQYVEIDYTSFLAGSIIPVPVPVPVQEAEYIPFNNFMTLKISNVPRMGSLIASIPLSFDAILKSAGDLEKERLKSYIKTVHSLQSESISFFLAPILNVCQSSGSGKSKIAAELMFDVPSCYVVLRNNESNSARGFPEKTILSELFMSIPKDLNDSFVAVSEFAFNSITGRYLLLLKAVLFDYYELFKDVMDNTNNDIKAAFKEIYKTFFNGKFFGDDLKFYNERSRGDWSGVFMANDGTRKFTLERGLELTVKNVQDSCNVLLVLISRLFSGSGSRSDTEKEFPFVLTIDEASFLTDIKSKSGVNFFRLFRRAAGCLKAFKFVVLTLGTNSDILDLNPESTIDSYRLESEDANVNVIDMKPRLFPPFIISRNWDIFLDYEEMIAKPIGYHQMVCSKMIIFWMSLGRPVWSSVSFERLMEFINIKICNNSVASGEAYLAFWMIRVGLMVHPHHVVAKHLIKSLMATLLYTSNDLSSMRAYYPSEPALAIGARSFLGSDGNVESYYEFLAKFVEMRAIDTGRFSEIISADICLLAFARAKKETCHWDAVNIDSIPDICKSKNFILKSSGFNLDESKIQTESIFNESLTESNLQPLKDSYMIVNVGEYISSMYGLDVFEKIDNYGLMSLKSARLNISHFSQMLTKFPFESLNQFKCNFGMTVSPVVDPKASKRDKSCCQVTAETLESMVMRGSGAMLAPNTFGLDHITPMCLKPISDDLTSKPEYSYIGVQVKRGSISNIRPIIAKGALSNHYVRCGLHGSENCEPGCNFRLSDETYKKILENGLILIHSMEICSGYDSEDDEDEGDDGDVEDEDVEDKDDIVEGFNAMVVDTECEDTECKDTVSNDSDISNDDSLYEDIINSDSSYDSESTNDEKNVPSKRAKKEPKITFECRLPEIKHLYLELANLKKNLMEKVITRREFEEAKDVINAEMVEIVQERYPNLLNESEIENFAFKPLILSHYRKCRFVPDVYISIPISDSVSVHVMIKNRIDGICEKLTAIYSRGLASFSNVLTKNAQKIAEKLIFSEHSIFEEVSSAPIKSTTKASIKYTELVSGVVSRNNGAALPIASNFIRKKYNLPEIPNMLPEYKDVTTANIREML